MAYKKYEENRH